MESTKSDQVEIEMKPTDGHPSSNNLAPSERRLSRFPILFERSAQSWWNPRFDSDILEAQHCKSSLPQSQQRFRFALAYVALSCVVWCFYFGFRRYDHWIVYFAGTGVLLAIAVALFTFSFTLVYQKFMIATSLVTSIILCGFDLLSYVFKDSDLSDVGTFVGSVEILMMMYTLIPLPLYMCVSAGVLYSIAFEILFWVRIDEKDMVEANLVACRALLHLCIHLIGIHLFITSQVRKHSTFLKVGQSTLARRDLEVEKRQKENMIHSLMPPKVAEEIMKARETDRDRDAQDEEDQSKAPQHRDSSSTKDEKGKIRFRTFHMNQLENVTILYADIVGFTKMSSNKSAVLLVRLLNDLFGRFDDICTRTNCEKISTLGDCYYCVSGCPEPRDDHAKCCVEMGLQMCVAIMEFDQEHNEEVNMRVGVHTGTVLCGLVGTRRFKFDVWSHDVTFANMMESEGRAGRVHCSDVTYNFVKDLYEFEAGDPVEDLRKDRRLVEDYNTETQQYRVRHVESTNQIKTWYVKSRKLDVNGEIVIEPVSSGVNQPHPTPAAPTEDKETGEQGDGNTATPASSLIPKHENSSIPIADEQNGELSANPGSTGGIRTIKLSGEEKDRELVKSMHDSPDVVDYLYKPPINKFTLNFLTPAQESDYRRHYLDDAKSNNVATFALPRISSLLDMIVSVIFFLTIATCCFIGFHENIRPVWVVIFIIAGILQIIVLVPMLCDVCSARPGPSLARVARFIAGWYPRHLCGSVVASLPTIAVYSTFSCHMNNFVADLAFCLFIITSLLHYCNFTMLSSWMKSALAVIAGIILLILLGAGVCPESPEPCESGGEGLTTVSPLDSVSSGDEDDNSTMCLGAVGEIFSGEHELKYEMIVDMALFLLLVCFLNREIEISYRLCYHGDIQAAKDRLKIETEKEQADWLLHNIVPEHVAEHMKTVGNFYCKNHKEVGVIFAKVCNFDDFYDESFEGGREYLRVLNELIGDFEDLFDLPKYRDIEKIKTIGSCLMAASGLNPQTYRPNRDPNAHLYALMDFSIDILKKLENFNKDIFNFDFEMSIGYNFGEVTAGVIGTTKLLYDIWGDTVNIASRMYSTGVHQRIQVPESTKIRLESKFDFEYRGPVQVKGKGEMQTYLLVGKKPGATWD